MAETKSFISLMNSTSLPLGVAGVFTGEGEDLKEYTQVSVFWTSDVEPTSVELQFSTDNVNWDIAQSYTTSLNSLGLWTGTAEISPKTRFFRVVYTNGVTAQGVLRVQSVYRVFSSTSLVSDQSDFFLDVNLGLVDKYDAITVHGHNIVSTSYTVVNSGFAGGTTMPFLSAASPIRVKAGGNAADDGQMVGVLTMVGIFLDGEDVTLGTRVYTFEDTLTDVNGNIQIASTKAFETLTFTGNANDGGTVVLGAKTYTFQATLTDVDGNVTLGDSAETSIDNLVAAITLAAGAGTIYAASTTAGSTTASKATAATMLSTLKVSGTAGNGTACTTTLTNATWGAATHTGGLDDTEGTIDNLVAAIDLSGVAGTDYALSMVAHPDIISPYDLVCVNGTGTVMDVTCNALGLVTTDNLTNGSWVAGELVGGAGARSIMVTYLNEDWDMVTEEVGLKGALASDVFDQDAIRILAVFVRYAGTYGGNNTGLITLEATTPATDLSYIDAGEGRSHQSNYSIPAGYIGVVYDLTLTIGKANTADVQFWLRPNGDVVSGPMTAPQIVGDFHDITEFTTRSGKPYGIFPSKSDWYIHALKSTGGGSTSEVSIIYSLILYKL